jgi:hypothetical protein
MLPLRRVVFKDTVRLGKRPDNLAFDHEESKTDIQFDKDVDAVVLTDIESGDTIDVPRSQVRFWVRRDPPVPTKRGPGRPPKAAPPPSNEV